MGVRASGVAAAADWGWHSRAGGVVADVMRPREFDELIVQKVGVSLQIAHETFGSELNIERWDGRHVEFEDDGRVKAPDAQNLLVDGGTQGLVGADAASFSIPEFEVRKCRTQHRPHLVDASFREHRASRHARIRHRLSVLGLGKGWDVEKLVAVWG